MSKRHDKIKELLNKAKDEGLSNAFIARRLGMTPQNFNYHLNESPELDLDLYNSIIREVQKYITVDDNTSTSSLPKVEEDKSVYPEFDDAIPINKYPVLGTVYAGEPKLLYHQSYEESSFFAYNRLQHRCFALKVNGNSMETTLKDGDEVLVDMDAALENGCLAAVKLKNGHQYIKRYYDVNFAFIKLTSDNEEYGVRLIDKNDINAIYRVVRINLKI
ncbi:MAG: S24 family peptidase [Ignavibacteriaceae bacterium]|nr:S24 family peptidase [Ignavibacteriaceae bacterium]